VHLGMNGPPHEERNRHRDAHDRDQDDQHRREDEVLRTCSVLVSRNRHPIEGNKCSTLRARQHAFPRILLRIGRPIWPRGGADPSVVR